MLRKYRSKKEKGMVGKELTHKQKRFCHEYLIDLNAKQAAIRAGYSKKNAQFQASRMLTNANVSGILQKLRDKQLAKIDLSTEEVLSAIKEIGFSDPRKAFDQFCRLLPVNEWPPEVARCIVSVEIVEEFQGKGDSRELTGYVKKVRFWNKNDALEMCMRYLGLYDADNKQKSEFKFLLYQSFGGSQIPEFNPDENGESKPQEIKKADPPIDITEIHQVEEEGINQ